MNGIPGTRVTAYTFEADYHCVEDTAKRFGEDEYGSSYGTDSEGNEIHPFFSMDSESEFEVCADCGRVICTSCGHTMAMDDWLDQTGEDYNRCSNCHTQAEDH